MTLEPGNYHLVADASTLEEPKTALGLTIDALGNTTAEDEQLASDSAFAHEVRLYEFLEIQATRTLTLNLDARIDTITNYSLGIFANGTAVPSPTFEDCLPVNTLSVDTTQSVTLEESSSREDQVFYRVELEEQEYVLDASTSSIENTTLGYSFVLLDQFGQTNREEAVTSDSEFSNILTTSDTFDRESIGSVWLRVENRFDDDVIVEFTVSTP